MNFSSIQFLEDQVSKQFFAGKMVNSSVKAGKERLLSTQLKTFSHKNTQTNYRESETQTGHQIPSNSIINSYNLYSVFSAPKKGYTSKPESEIPDVNKIRDVDHEPDRNQLQQKLISVGKQNLHMQIAITKQIERIEWITKTEVGASFTDLFQRDGEELELISGQGLPNTENGQH